MAQSRQPYVTQRSGARRRSASPASSHRTPRRRNPVPLLAFIILALLGGSVWLIVRLFFSTPAGTQQTPAPQSTAALSAAPGTTVTPGETAAPGETAVPGEATEDPLAAYFTDGDKVVTDTDFRNENINIHIEKMQGEDVVYYVADIRLRDANLLSSALAHGHLGSGLRTDLTKLAQDSDAILAVTGDLYGTRGTGIVLRNGSLYRNDPVADVCALLPDGTLAILSPGDPACDGEALLTQGALQVWSSGPSLLSQGEAIDDFSAQTPLTTKAPRAALGMIEPLHYVLVVVDGRQPDVSMGMTLSELSHTMKDLGCTVAYSLAQGNTVGMIFNDKVVSQPSGEDWEHKVSDAIIVAKTYTPLAQE